MSIVTEIKREYKKVSNEVDCGQRRMKALECTLREYKVWNYPYSEAISDLVLDFIMQHDREVEFDEITAMLVEKNIEIPHQKLSMVLNRHPQLVYNRQKQKWGIRTPINDNRA